MIPEDVKAIRRSSAGLLVSVIISMSPESTPADVFRVVNSARRLGMSCNQKNPGKYNIRLSCDVETAERVFGVHLIDCKDEYSKFRVADGHVSVPESFGNKVVSVIGLGTRRIVRPHFKRLGTAIYKQGFSPNAITKAYQLPDGDGVGQSVAVLGYDGGYEPASMQAYLSDIRVNRTPSMTVVGSSPPGPNNIEIMLDTEIIAGFLQCASIFLYLDEGTEAGFYSAMLDAIAGSHDAVSISYGFLESAVSLSYMTSVDNLAATAAANNTTIVASSGDDGSSGGLPGLNVNFPASSPCVLGVGGTSLITSCASRFDGSYVNEIVWNNSFGATGGGESAVFPIPSYQQAVSGGRSNRLVPDVAANGDTATGFRICVGGEFDVVGGTSAATPLWAAFICKLNKLLGRRLGFVNPQLYGLTGSLRQVTQGNNGAYQAGSPYNMCTGLGTPTPCLLDLLR